MQILRTKRSGAGLTLHLKSDYISLHFTDDESNLIVQETNI